MIQDTLNYPLLIDHAMRGVVREILRRVEQTGLPGEHHFYVSFDTTFPGVKMSETLRAKYPKEMTVVLQHQFWDFRVEDQQFHVTLSFNGVPEKITIPFIAMTAFADPSTKFGLQFQHREMNEPANQMVSITSVAPVFEDIHEEAKDAAEIISLDSFRKK